jgi:hypothetical protein
MHPKQNNYPYLYTSQVAYQGAALSAGAATGGSAVSLNLRGSFSVSCTIAGVTGSPTAYSVTLALQSSNDGSTWRAINDKSGNAVTVQATNTAPHAVVAVDTQYMTIGDDRVRVVPTVAFTGGTSPTAYFTSALTYEAFDHL